MASAQNQTNQKNMIYRNERSSEDQTINADRSSRFLIISNTCPVFYDMWAEICYVLREPLAEFSGTFILVLIGTAGNAQGTLFSNGNVSTASAGGWLSVALGWGFGVGLGAWVAGSFGVGHINPAITIAMATFRGFSWKKVPIFIFSQLLGGIVGAAVTYANYIHAIDLFEGGRSVRTVPGSAAIFGTYAVSYLTNVSAFWDEFLGTFILVIVLLTALDSAKAGGSQSRCLVPLALFFTLFGIGMTFGAQTGFAVNPARDLGPRIFTAMAGYGREVFNFRHQYWLWGGIISPIVGALVATFVYDIFMYTGSESIRNRSETKKHEIMQTAEVRIASADTLQDTEHMV